MGTARSAGISSFHKMAMGTGLLLQTVYSLLTLWTLSPTSGLPGLGGDGGDGLPLVSEAPQQAVFTLVLLLPPPRLIQKKNLRQGKGPRRKKEVFEGGPEVSGDVWGWGRGREMLSMHGIGNSKLVFSLPPLFFFFLASRTKTSWLELLED